MKSPPAKQRARHEDWVDALATIWERVTPEHIERRIDQAAERVRSFAAVGRHLAFGWSGGKESVALEAVCARAGVDECVLVICELEYPEFLTWATDHMPPGLEIVNTGLDLAWLRAHPRQLFPTTAADAAVWFQSLQHRGQRTYYRRRNLDALLIGRRTGDGNYVGPRGQWYYTNAEGLLRASPLHDWTNDDLLGCIALLDLPLAPCYRWVRGFRVGTGPWPARQWTKSIAHGWSEVYSIDPRVVEEAADVLSSAREFLDSR